MKLELHHIAPYLPYGLKVQYEGILNGKEISAFHKANYANDPMDNLNYKPITPVMGNKIGLVKSIRFYKAYFKVDVGRYHGHLKACINGYDFKPILRPMSSLTKNELLMAGFDSHIDYLTHELQKPDNESRTDSRGQKLWRIEHAPYEMVAYLISKHYDVFSLIPAGLAGPL